MRSVPLCFAVLGFLICAAYASAETADLDASLFAAELTYNHAGVDLVGRDDQSSEPYEVVVGSVRVSFLVQRSDNARDGLEPPEATKDNSFWRHMPGQPDGQVRLIPACAPELADGESIPETFEGVTAQSLPEPATVLLLASSAVVFSRRWLKR